MSLNSAVEVVRKPVRFVRLRVRADGTLRVTAPAGVDITPYLEGRADWIEKKRKHFDAAVAEWEGWEDRLVIGGMPCRLEAGGRCAFDPEAMTVHYTTPATLRRSMKAWLREDLDERLEEAAAAMGAAPRRIRIGMQTTRWGSCSGRGTLSFNLRLLALPADLRNYVVVHELAHLLVPDHSPAFWETVARHYPGVREAERALDRYWILLERNRPWQTIARS